ncbi:MAG: hypothetical protein JKY70_02885 [Mucilaginibacter sp.]|nr:hypothetical protein [Mucilaginibacter sp.]
MKICVSNNSVKYRLTPSEVEAFAHDGLYKEKVQFGDDSLTYAIQRTAEAKISVSFKNNIIALLVPEKIADEWTATDKISLQASQDDLLLSIEKDFDSPDVVNENHSSNFINPFVLENLDQQK